MLTSSTGTSIQSYLDWVKKELDKKSWGEVTISFTVNKGIVVDVKKTSMDHEHYQLPKGGE